MDNAVAPEPTTPPLDIRTLLARVNHRIALVRGWLSHDHGDEPFWWARKTTAPAAQRERAVLRGVANLLHVERAHARGRLHSTQHATLDEQAAWLTERAARCWALSPTWLELPSNATLQMLRDGKLPL